MGVEHRHGHRDASDRNECHRTRRWGIRRVGRLAGPGFRIRARPPAFFSLSLLLGIAYGASIGGIGTLIGTPPNLFLASYMQNTFDLEISFVRWMGVGLPLVLVFLPIAWLALTKWLYPVAATDLGRAPPSGTRFVTSDR